MKSTKENTSQSNSVNRPITYVLSIWVLFGGFVGCILTVVALIIAVVWPISVSENVEKLLVIIDQPAMIVMDIIAKSNVVGHDNPGLVLLLVPYYLGIGGFIGGVIGVICGSIYVLLFGQVGPGQPGHED